MNTSQILAALSTETDPARQRVLVAQLREARLRSAQAAQAQASRATGRARVADRLTPVHAHSHHTSETDWLGKVAGNHDTSEVHHKATAAATEWFRSVNDSVRAHPGELSVQAQWYANRWGSQFGMESRVAVGSFLQRVSHLAGFKIAADDEEGGEENNATDSAMDEGNDDDPKNKTDKGFEDDEDAGTHEDDESEYSKKEGARKTAARAKTKFTVCPAHQMTFAGETRYRLAEYFSEGGPAFGPPCSGEGCKIAPGTDLFRADMCEREYSVLDNDGLNPFQWAVNARTASRKTATKVTVFDDSEGYSIDVNVSATDDLDAIQEALTENRLFASGGGWAEVNGVRYQYEVGIDPNSTTGTTRTIRTSWGLRPSKGDRTFTLSSRKTAARPIYEIADEIRRDWKDVNFAARPYLDAMRYLSDPKDMYGAEQGRWIVAYFLENSKQWKGDKAKEIKAELRAMVKSGARKTATVTCPSCNTQWAGNPNVGNVFRRDGQWVWECPTCGAETNVSGPEASEIVSNASRTAASDTPQVTPDENGEKTLRNGWVSVKGKGKVFNPQMAQLVLDMAWADRGLLSEGAARIVFEDGDPTNWAGTKGGDDYVPMPWTVQNNAGEILGAYPSEERAKEEFDLYRWVDYDGRTKTFASKIASYSEDDFSVLTNVDPAWGGYSYTLVGPDGSNWSSGSGYTREEDAISAGNERRDAILRSGDAAIEQMIQLHTGSRRTADQGFGPDADSQSGQAESQLPWVDVSADETFEMGWTQDDPEGADEMAPEGEIGPFDASLRRRAVSLTNVGFEGGIGSNTAHGYTADGRKVIFRLSDQDAKDLANVMTSDMAINFSGVDVDEADIISTASRRTASRTSVEQDYDGRWYFWTPSNNKYGPYTTPDEASAAAQEWEAEFPTLDEFLTAPGPYTLGSRRTADQGFGPAADSQSGGAESALPDVTVADDDDTNLGWVSDGDGDYDGSMLDDEGRYGSRRQAATPSWLNASRKQARTEVTRFDDGHSEWKCGQCGSIVERWPGMSDVDCAKCGAWYNAGGQRLRDDWMGNSSNWDDDVDDMEGYERQQLRGESRLRIKADAPFSGNEDGSKPAGAAHQVEDTVDEAMFEADEVKDFTGPEGAADTSSTPQRGPNGQGWGYPRQSPNGQWFYASKKPTINDDELGIW